MYATLWGYKHKATFFWDIPPVKKSETPPVKKSENRKERRSSKEDTNMSKKSKTEEETPKSSKPSKSQRTLDWETPKEELERRQLHKLDSRRRERSGHEDGQEKVATTEGKKKEKPSPLITLFTAINESNGENDENKNKTEESTGTISPLWKDSKPELYDDHNKPTRAETQYAIVAKDEGVEISEESEKDIEVEPVVNQVVETSAVHSELDYDQEEIENDPEEFERYKVSEEPRALIMGEPQSEDGYEQDREINIESEEEAPASPPRQVVFRDTPASRRRRQFKTLRKALHQRKSCPKKTRSPPYEVTYVQSAL
jgi:hypothetical protein